MPRRKPPYSSTTAGEFAYAGDGEFTVAGPPDYEQWVAVWTYDDAGEATSAEFQPVVWDNGSGTAGPFAADHGQAYVFEYPYTHTPISPVLIF